MFHSRINCNDFVLRWLRESRWVYIPVWVQVHTPVYPNHIIHTVPQNRTHDPGCHLSRKLIKTCLEQYFFFWSNINLVKCISCIILLKLNIIQNIQYYRPMSLGIKSIWSSSVPMQRALYKVAESTVRTCSIYAFQINMSHFFKNGTTIFT